MTSYVQTKNAQNVFVTFAENLKKNNNCYLVFGDIKDAFCFLKRINIKHCWLHRKTMLHSRDTKVTGG